MQQRVFQRAGVRAGVVGLGTWQLGADWGTVSEDDAMATLTAAVEAGTDFLDTADVYGDGRSERIIGAFLRGRSGDPTGDPTGDRGTGSGRITVATKMGRRVEQRPEHYTLDNFRAWTDRSRANLGVDTLDLVQLHCPPTPVFSSDAVFDALDTLVAERRIRAYGVSVETCAQALTAIARPGVASVQIIFNPLRLKPLDEVLPAATAAGVGVIVRVPLASGLLSGRYDERTTFAENDHRTYNRRGEAFDVGETFSGVDFATGLAAVRRLAAAMPDAVPEGTTMAQFALRWIIDHPAVTVVIPGARDARQARDNAAAAELPPLPAAAHRAVVETYDRLLRPSVHDRW